MYVEWYLIYLFIILVLRLQLWPSGFKKSIWYFFCGFTLVQVPNVHVHKPINEQYSGSHVLRRKPILLVVTLSLLLFLPFLKKNLHFIIRVVYANSPHALIFLLFINIFAVLHNVSHTWKPVFGPVALTRILRYVFFFFDVFFFHRSPLGFSGKCCCTQQVLKGNLLYVWGTTPKRCSSRSRHFLFPIGDR